MNRLATIPFLLILFFAGCQKDNTLVTPEADKSNAIQKPAWVLAAEKQGLTLISLPQSSPASLKKNYSVTALIKHDQFGKLNIDESYRASNNREVTVEASLSVLANSLPQDKSLSMNFEDNYLCIEFGPSGTNFAAPALLNIKVTGLDLSALGNSSSAHLKYFDESRNEWTTMQADEVSIDVQNGTFTCKNGKIPHFSRYGFTN